MHTKKVLFICKKRVSYGASYGLLNSARFVSNELNKWPGIESKVIDVVDNNAIDREVTLYKPTHVIIEALWVVPSKFPVLIKLHPKVQWIIRLHSKPAFLANEGIGMEWVTGYFKLAKQYPQISVSINNKEFATSLSKLFNTHVSYSPNIYPNIHLGELPENCNSLKEIHVGCFGAIRPMKNHLTQALAALEYAKCTNKHLYFHINGTRIEQKGEEVIKNLRALFKNLKCATLVEHGWLNHLEFLELVSNMDIGMQVSLSETFNIVAADFTKVGVPILVCKDIDWAPILTRAEPSHIESIFKGMFRVFAMKKILVPFTQLKLIIANLKAKLAWRRILGN